MTRKIAIVGAGITGLVCAYRLQELGVEVTVFEVSERAGGPIGSHRSDEGFLAECGPHTILESNEAVKRLVAELGLDGERVYADDASKKRFLVRDGRARALPTSPPALLGTDVFSRRAKLSLLKEPFVSRRDDEIDESVASFVKRRFGEELLHYGFELLINGVWAGDPRTLSMRHAFPKIWELEREYGSVILGALRRAASGDRGDRPKMMSFRDGNGVLAETLAAGLDDLRTGRRIRKISRRDDGKWRVDRGTYDEVVLTVGPRALEELDLGVDTSFAAEIRTPTVAVLTLGFRRGDVDHPLDGFGMIAPMREHLDILGALFTSTLFPDRAPPGHVTMGIFIGGMRRPDMVDLEHDERLGRALESLRRTLGVTGEPVFVHEVVWDHAIPQYEVGYGRQKVRMQALEKSNPGLHIAGNLADGVAVPDLIEAGDTLARRLAGA